MLKWLKRLVKRGPTVTIPNSAELIEGESRTIELGDIWAGGTQVLLCRVDGQVYALDTECPHGEGGRITRGPLLGGRHALCPLHNYRFEPQTGKAVGGACGPARRFKVRERDGQIELWT